MADVDCSLWSLPSDLRYCFDKTMYKDTVVLAGDPTIVNDEGNAWGNQYPSWLGSVWWICWKVEQSLIAYVVIVLILLLDRFVQVLLHLKSPNKRKPSQLLLYGVMLFHMTLCCDMLISNTIHNYAKVVDPAGLDSLTNIGTFRHYQTAFNIYYYTSLLVLYMKQRSINTMPGAPESVISTVGMVALTFFCFPLESVFWSVETGPTFGQMKTKGYDSSVFSDNHGAEAYGMFDYPMLDLGLSNRLHPWLPPLISSILGAGSPYLTGLCTTFSLKLLWASSLVKRSCVLCLWFPFLRHSKHQKVLQMQRRSRKSSSEFL